jgi:hypothetical protein
LGLVTINIWGPPIGFKAKLTPPARPFLDLGQTTANMPPAAAQSAPKTRPNL